ncbi:MAG: NAD-dependent epimerase/dehydratase family protein, partial [Promethearchaeota archaeon]
MTTCLILGGNGFLGSHLAEGLVKRGYDVRVFDSFQTDMANLETIKGKIEIMSGDFLDHADLLRALKGMDYVFHYISTTVPSTAVKDPIYDVQTNVIGTVRLLQLAVASKVKRVIFPSSGGTIYGEPNSVPVRETHALNPMDPYGISKLAIEKYLSYYNRAHGLDYLILRYSNPYGERQNPHGQQGVIPVFLNRIKMGERPVIYGDGSVERDYVYVGDATEATIAALERKTAHKIFNVGSGAGTSLNQLVKIMSGVAGKKIEPIYTEDTAVRVQKIILDVSRIRDEVGWKPRTGLQEGMEKTWRWIT